MTTTKCRVIKIKADSILKSLCLYTSFERQRSHPIHIRVIYDIKPNSNGFFSFKTKISS